MNEEIKNLNKRLTRLENIHIYGGIIVGLGLVIFIMSKNLTKK